MYKVSATNGQTGSLIDSVYISSWLKLYPAIPGAYECCFAVFISSGTQRNLCTFAAYCVHITRLSHQYFHSRERHILHGHEYLVADERCQAKPVLPFFQHVTLWALLCQHTPWKHPLSMLGVLTQRMSEV